MKIFRNKKEIMPALFKKSLPLILAMMFQSSYAIVDSIYVGRGLGLKAIGGISVAIPIILFVQALIFAISVGAVVYIARLRGEENHSEISKVVNNVMSYSIIIAVLITTIIQIFSNSIISSLVSDIVIRKYALTFLKTSSWFIIFQSIQISWSRIFLAEGNSTFASAPGIIFVVSNIILGYIFIFILKLGMNGVALATGLSQVCAALSVLILWFIGRKTTILKWDKNYKLLEFKMILVINKYGVVPFIRNISQSLLNVVIIKTLVSIHKVEYIPIVGIIGRLNMLTVMSSFGVMQGSNPQLGFNYGAKNYKFILPIFNSGIVLMTMVILFNTLIISMFNYKVVALFTNNAWAVKEAYMLFMLQMIGQILSPAALNSSFYFQTRARTILATFISLLPTVLFPIPLLYIGAKLFGIVGIYNGISLGIILSSIISYIIVKKDISSLLKKT